MLTWFLLTCLPMVYLDFIEFSQINLFHLYMFFLLYIKLYCLTHNLLGPIVISLCSKYRLRPACMPMQSDQTIYNVLLIGQLQILIYIPPKLIMDCSKNGRWTSSLRNSAGSGLENCCFLILSLFYNDFCFLFTARQSSCTCPS